jgi:hypothetical protein
MKWKKLGLVFKDTKRNWWSQSHAYIPTPILLEDRVRVFVSFWDVDKRGRLGYVDLALDDITRVIGVSKTPALDLGDKDAFDCKGITPMSYVVRDGVIFLFYTGWGNHPEYPYTLLTGLAVSDNNGESFTRFSKKPVLPPIKGEGCIRTAAFIDYIPEFDEYWLWYVGGEDWFYADNKLTPTYDLRLVRSSSLYDWTHLNSTLVMESDITKGEYAIGRPCVIRENGLFKLFYSSRRYNHGYRLGYAESIDGFDWKVKDHRLNFPISEIGWDSKMQCFSYILPTATGTYMFYNGNEHGKQGFGIAELSND